MKRKAVGIWECRGCSKVVAGGAWQMGYGEFILVDAYCLVELLLLLLFVVAFVVSVSWLSSKFVHQINIYYAHAT